jgi:hypothetical protein
MKAVGLDKAIEATEREPESDTPNKKVKDE